MVCFLGKWAPINLLLPVFNKDHANMCKQNSRYHTVHIVSDFLGTAEPQGKKQKSQPERTGSVRGGAGDETATSTQRRLFPICS